MTRYTRLAVVPALALALSGLAAATPTAHASSCGSGTPFTGVTTGFNDGYSDYWTTQSAGAMTLALVPQDQSLWMNVYDGSCNHVCSYVQQCVVPSRGTILVVVDGYIRVDYALVATSSPAAAPTGPVTCNLVDTAGVCVSLGAGSVIDEVTVRGVEAGQSGTHHVVGHLDRYAFALPGGGSFIVPCVVLGANSTQSNACAAAGATFVSRFATLVDQQVRQPSAGLDDPLVTLRLCNARLTATVAGFGAEELPAVAVC